MVSKAFVKEKESLYRDIYCYRDIRLWSYRPPLAPSVCALGWVKCREHISLLVILCIIVYVTNKKLFFSRAARLNAVVAF